MNWQSQSVYARNALCDVLLLAAAYIQAALNGGWSNSEVLLSTTPPQLTPELDANVCVDDAFSKFVSVHVYHVLALKYRAFKIVVTAGNNLE
jgi:hypothetical protein